MNEDLAVSVLGYQLNMKDTDVYTPINYDAIEAILKAYKRLIQENLDLVDLYKRTANHLRKKGNEELALYFLAQINETPSFGTMDLYDNWINRSKVEELKVKIYNDLVKNFGEYRANQFQIDRYFMEL